MSRLTQMIEFLNTDPIPTNEEMKFNYTSINKTEKLKSLRKQYRKNIGKHDTEEKV